MMMNHSDRFQGRPWYVLGNCGKEHVNPDVMQRLMFEGKHAGCTSTGKAEGRIGVIRLYKRVVKHRYQPYTMAGLQMYGSPYLCLADSVLCRHQHTQTV